MLYVLCKCETSPAHRVLHDLLGGSRVFFLCEVICIPLSDLGAAEAVLDVVVQYHQHIREIDLESSLFLLLTQKGYAVIDYIPLSHQVYHLWIDPGYVPLFSPKFTNEVKKRIAPSLSMSSDSEMR